MLVILFIMILLLVLYVPPSDYYMKGGLINGWNRTVSRQMSSIHGPHTDVLRRLPASLSGPCDFVSLSWASPSWSSWTCPSRPMVLKPEAWRSLLPYTSVFFLKIHHPSKDPPHFPHHEISGAQEVVRKAAMQTTNLGQCFSNCSGKGLGSLETYKIPQLEDH